MWMSLARSSTARLEQIVDRAHNRRAARQIAQAVDIVFPDGAASAPSPGFVWSSPSRRSSSGRDVLERRDMNRERLAEHDDRSLYRRGIARIGDRDEPRAGRGFAREDRHLAQEAARELLDERTRVEQIRQPGARQVAEPRDLIGEVGGGQLAALPQLSETRFTVGGLRRRVVGVRLTRKPDRLAEMLDEIACYHRRHLHRSGRDHA